ncbi:MAG: AI-2E family transporter [Thermovenabulum sp.]|uniref:AI-2E family transporter n=1 Tax=Thermovenabulum sp. TaxID=3100335 RepID=UPI003C7BF183
MEVNLGFKKYRKKLLYFFLIISSVVVFLLFRKKIKIIILPFIIGIVIAYVLNPVVNFLVKKGIKRTVAVAIIYFILIGYTVVTLFYVIPVLIIELNKIIELLPNYSKDVQRYFTLIKGNIGDNIPPSIRSVIENQILRFETQIVILLQNTMNMIIQSFSSFFSTVILGPIVGFYLLKDLEKIKKNIELLLPEKYRSNILVFLKKVDLALGKYIRGQLIVCFIIGVLTSFTLYLLKVDFALLIGILAAVTDIIPYFGPIIGAFPALAIALIKYPQKIPWIVISLAIIQQVESGIISPYIVGENLDLHPLIVIFSLLFGGTFFGIWGLIFAAPIAAVIKLLIISYIKKKGRVKF